MTVHRPAECTGEYIIIAYILQFTKKGNFKGTGGEENGRRKTEQTADKQTGARRVTAYAIIDNVRQTERDAGDMCNSAGSQRPCVSARARARACTFPSVTRVIPLTILRITNKLSTKR